MRQNAEPTDRIQKEDAMSKSSSSASGSGSSASATTAETRANAYAARTAAREQRLRAHPHADVQGPELVACRLCGQQIKLSTKSAYDAFHWTKHIERCARRAPAGRAQRTKRATERKQRSQTSKDAVHPPVKVHTGLTIRLRGKDGPISMFKSSLGDPLDAVEAPTLGVKEEEPEYDVLVPDDKYFRNIMKTRPPAFEFVMRMFGPYGKPNYGRKRGELGVSALAPSSDKDSSLPPAFMKGLGGEGEERDEEMSAPEMGVGMEQSEMETGPDTEPEVEPEPEPEVREPSVHELEPDIVLEDYYHRSRRRGTRELSPFTIEGARAWSWSQVKEAVWIIKSYPGSHDNESDGEVEGERGRIEEKEGEGEIEGAVKQRGEDEAGVEVKVEEEAETSVNWDGGMEPDPKSKPVDTLRTETEGGVSENTNAFKNT